MQIYLHIQYLKAINQRTLLCELKNHDQCQTFYSVFVSVSCPKALCHLESDNIFRITVVAADWLG